MTRRFVSDLTPLFQLQWPVTVRDYIERSVTLARFARGPREQREIGPTPLIRGTGSRNPSHRQL